MKKISNIIFIIIIGVICFSFMFIFLFTKKNDYSEDENRYLETFKIDNVDNYINDHFPFRKNLITLKNKFLHGIGKTYINDIYIGKNNYLIPEFKNNNNKEYIINTINTFADNNSNVDVMIIPDSILINEDKLNDKLSISEEMEINYLYSKLKTNNINLINSFKINNKIHNNLYYKTDHHWTSYGAYLAYTEYFINKKKNYLSIYNFNIKKISNDFLGTSYYKVLGLGKKEDMYLFDKNVNVEVNYVYEKNVTKSLYNYDYLDTKDKYSFFLDNNHALIEINNKDINDNSSILIIKNSYANSFIPFIVDHYDKVYVIDLRYYNYKVSDYVRDNNITDILILYNLNNLYSDMSIIKLK